MYFFGCFWCMELIIQKYLGGCYLTNITKASSRNYNFFQPQKTFHEKYITFNSAHYVYHLESLYAASSTLKKSKYHGCEYTCFLLPLAL